MKAMKFTSFRLAAILACIAATCSVQVSAQDDIRTEAIPFGDFEQWTTRIIKESAVLGGDSIKVYAIDDGGTVRGNNPYTNRTSPWSSSNALATVSGIVKTNVNVRPAPNGDGLCAEMSTEAMSFKVLGTVRVTVLTAGAVYLGRLLEPIRGMDDAMSYIDMGIPFTGRPEYLIFDYAATIRNSGTVSKITGMKKKDFPGSDRAIAYIKLQKRTERDGHIYATRVATGQLVIDRSTDWKKDVKVRLAYGKPDFSLTPLTELGSSYYAVNSEGEAVPVEETGWAASDETPTHLIIYFASGSLDPFTGELGNSLKIDNVRLGYKLRIPPQNHRN